MLPSFKVRTRVRPIDLVAPGFVQVRNDHEGRWALPQPAPYVAIAAQPVGQTARLTLTSGGVGLSMHVDNEEIWLTVTDTHTTTHRSRRSSKVASPPTDLALALTGSQVTAFAHERTGWTARATFDLRERLDTQDETFCANLVGEVDGQVKRVRGGAFGQLGLRDIRLVTNADGSPIWHGGHQLLLTATHAGPGQFGSGHTGVWSLDPATSSLRHLSDLFFRRPDKAGVFGDHATHLVRDGDRWLVATSTWGDFDQAHRDATVQVTLAETDAPLLNGRHVLDTTAMDLPTTGLTSRGVWDPHLVRDGHDWLVGYVNAAKFFSFHPVVAAGPSLDNLTLRAADPTRRATEGTTLMQLDGAWRVLASDGRDGRRGQRLRFPIFDLNLNEIGEIDAEYVTNIPWPTLVDTIDGWLMITFNGSPVGGRVVGYGSHGDLVIMDQRG